MAKETKLYCLCKKVQTGKPPKKYGIPTKKVYDGKSCTCAIIRKGKLGEPYIGDMKLMETKNG